MSAYSRLFAFGLAGLICQAGVAGSAWSAETGARPGKDWAVVGGNVSGDRYSPLDRINLQNVQKLGGAWTTEAFKDGASSRSTPVVHDGLMFVNAGPRVYAIDATNGKLEWSWLPDERNIDGVIAILKAGFGIPNPQGVAFGDGKIYVGLMDGRIAALNEKTGAKLWEQQIGDAPRRRGQTVTAAATFANGVVYAGLSGGDFGNRGRIVALDGKTGKELWHFFVVPGPGEPGHETWAQDNEIWKIGGGGVWQVGTVDPELGAVYFSIGNTVPQWGGEIREGNNLYTSSIVALDMKTGKLRWHFQAIHHDIWDADVATAPVLYDTQIDGKTVKVAAIIRPDGYMFLFDRATGKPIVPIEERPVPQNAASKTSKTQPYPVGGDSLLPDCSFWKDKIPAGFVCDSAFYPPAFPPPSKDAQNVLGPWFGVRNAPMSYSPQTGYIYARGTASLNWRRRAPDPYFFAGGLGFVPDMKAYGELAAFDGKTGKIAWKKEMPPEVLGGGGSIVTAGGLMFRLMGDGNFTAYNAKTGDIVWQFQTGHRGATGSPATYEVNGEQYIAVTDGPVVWGFKLDGKVPAAPTSAMVADVFGSYGGAFPKSDRIETTNVARDMAILGGSRAFTDPYSFNPPRTQVPVGTPVTFSNPGQTTYTIVAKDNSWTTGPIPVTEERVVKFDKPGLYTYYTKEYPWQYGQIMVTSDQVAQNGVYSAEQAKNGQALYALNCASCHLDSLMGSDAALPLAGPAFMSHWSGMTLADLYNRIRTTMPQKNPGTLSADAYLDITAYLLQANNMPAGPEALKVESPKLKTKMAAAK